MFRRGFILWYSRHMSGAGVEVHVELDGDEIIVTKPGTAFLVAYRKRPDSPTLKLTRSWEKPTVTSRDISEFAPTPFTPLSARRSELGGLCSRSVSALLSLRHPGQVSLHLGGVI